MQRTNIMEYIVRGDMPDLEQVRANCHREIRKYEITMPITPQRIVLRTAVIAIAVITLVSTTAFAAWYFLSPGDVAAELGNQALSAAFDSETAVNVNASVTSGDYTFTLLAVVTGRDITDMPYYNPDVQLDRTYAVVAIENINGFAMPYEPDESECYFTSPLIRGLNPLQYNVATMGGKYSDTVIDGILYRIVECDNIAVFADRGLYFAISTNSHPVAYNANAFIYEEQTGEIIPNPDFYGSSVVFDLPIDVSYADPERAKQYLAADPWSRDKELSSAPSDIATVTLPANLSEMDEVVRESAVLFINSILSLTDTDISNYPISLQDYRIYDMQLEFRTYDDIYYYFGAVDTGIMMVTILNITEKAASLDTPVREHHYSSAHEDAASRIMNIIDTNYSMSYWSHGNIEQHNVVTFSFEKEDSDNTYWISIDIDSYQFVGLRYYPYSVTGSRG